MTNSGSKLRSFYRKKLFFPKFNGITSLTMSGSNFHKIVLVSAVNFCDYFEGYMQYTVFKTFDFVNF